MAKPGLPQGNLMLLYRGSVVGLSSPSNTLSAGATSALVRATTDVAGFRSAAYRSSIDQLMAASIAFRGNPMASAQAMRAGANASSGQPAMSMAMALTQRAQYERTMRDTIAYQMGAY